MTPLEIFLEQQQNLIQQLQDNTLAFVQSLGEVQPPPVNEIPEVLMVKKACTENLITDPAKILDWVRARVADGTWSYQRLMYLFGLGKNGINPKRLNWLDPFYEADANYLSMLRGNPIDDPKGIKFPNRLTDALGTNAFPNMIDGYLDLGVWGYVQSITSLFIRTFESQFTVTVNEGGTAYPRICSSGTIPVPVPANMKGLIYVQRQGNTVDIWNNGAIVATLQQAVGASNQEIEIVSGTAGVVFSAVGVCKAMPNDKIPAWINSIQTLFTDLGIAV